MDPDLRGRRPDLRLLKGGAAEDHRDDRKARSRRAVPPAKAPPNSIDLDIIAGRLRAVVDEMATILVQTTLSPVINEARNFSCCICDSEGRLVAMSNGITILTGTISSQLKAIQRKVGSTIRPGDVFVTNDPYQGSAHTADITVVKPLFFEGELVCFTTVTAHINELGGIVGGALSPGALDVFQEGLRIPALRIVREGIRQDELLDLIAGNVRSPEMTVADLSAQLAVVKLGDARLRDLCESCGSNQLQASFERSLEAGEKISRAAIKRLPDGEYFGRDYIDGDGICTDRLPIQVKVTIFGDKIRADFSGSCSQRAAAPINCTRAVLEAAVKIALITVIDADAAMNDGWFRPLTVVAPDGTVFTAQYPAPTGWCYEAASHATDLVWKALAQVVPERLSAGGYTSLCATYFGGRSADGMADFVLVEPHVGGWGAMSNSDGANARIAAADGHTRNHPVELIEAKYPVRINRYALNTKEHAGAGKFRGGLGAVREYEILADGVSFYADIGRSRTAPWGLEGGEPGSVNYVEVESGGKTTKGARFPLRTLQRGDRIKVVTGHGGGYGDPIARCPSRVLDDVRAGYVDKATARSAYGVVVVSAPDEPAIHVDLEATSALRARQS